LRPTKRTHTAQCYGENSISNVVVNYNFSKKTSPLLNQPHPVKHQQMHTNDIILLRTTAAIAAILISYSVFTQPYLASSKNQGPHTLKHDTNGLNLTKLISCQTIPFIHIHIFATNAHALHRLVKALDAADYGPAAASITILGDYSVVQKLESWRHGDYQSATRSLSQLRRNTAQDADRSFVIIFDDHMDPGPLYALWFLIQRCAYPLATAIAGGEGSDTHKIAGLAMKIETWNGFVNYRASINNDTTTTASVISYLALSPNTSSIIFPSLASKDHTFVRSEWQNPAYVEQPPKLMRLWDTEHEPIWGALEVRL
jgi:hypothetical protein